MFVDLFDRTEAQRDNAVALLRSREASFREWSEEVQRERVQAVVMTMKYHQRARFARARGDDHGAAVMSRFYRESLVGLIEYDRSSRMLENIIRETRNRIVELGGEA